MTRNLIPALVLAAALCGACSQAVAAVPFAEDFNAGSSGWRFSTAIDLTPVASGGPDGSGYVSRTFAFSSLPNPAATSALIFRAQEEFNSSSQAYVGNWFADGVKNVTAYVRHNATEPLGFNVRLANPNNFPGASYLTTSAVPAGAWTLVKFNVTPGSPQNATYEGSDYSTIFSNIGHIQFGVDIPASLVGGTSSFTFDLDRVRVATVPEPAAAGLAALAVGGLALVVRRRR